MLVYTWQKAPPESVNQYLKRDKLQDRKKRTSTKKSRDPNSTTFCFEIGAFLYKAIKVVCCISFNLRVLKKKNYRRKSAKLPTDQERYLLF